MSNPLLSFKKDIEEQIGESPSEFLLNAVWDFIVAKIGYNPMLTDRVEHTKGNGTDRLYLAYRPVESIEKILVNNKEVSIPRFTDRYISLITTKDYEIYDDPTLYAHDITSEIEVRYTAGYETLPTGLLLAAICILNNIKDDLGESGNLKSYKIDTISYQFKEQTEKNAQVMTYLRPFISIF